MVSAMIAVSGQVIGLSLAAFTIISITAMAFVANRNRP